MIKNNKRWAVMFFTLSCIIFIIITLIVVIVDPYFHYHKPNKLFQYPINDERYQNNGIMRHFEYDAVITGTSMAEQFMVSEFNQLFNTDAIKVCFSGGYFKEINDNLKLAIKYNPNIKIIFRSFEGDYIEKDADIMRYEKKMYPNYLYDNSIFNDVNYVFNKDIYKQVLNVLDYTLKGKKTTTFDEYGDITSKRTYSKETAIKNYNRPEKSKLTVKITDESYKKIDENLEQNVISIAKENPNIEFYLFFPPYSILFWDRMNQEGTIEEKLQAEEYAVNKLLKYDNIHLYSFFKHYDVITNLDNYSDIKHYSKEINSKILKWISNGNDELSEDNYKDYYKELKLFYMNYDYESIFIDQ